MSLHRVKKYAIDHEGMQRACTLGVIDPETGQRSYWQPHLATEWLTDLMRVPDFDRDVYCDTKCQAYDDELAINHWQLRLPRLRPERLRQLMKNPVGLPWESRKPPQDVHVTPQQKSRPGRPARLEACHMCLLSYLDEVPAPPIPFEARAALQNAARAARDEVFRLLKAQANEANSEALAAYIVVLIEQARQRLRVAVRACWDAGFEPWRPSTRRTGEDAPTEVVATTWTRPEER